MFDIFRPAGLIVWGFASLGLVEATAWADDFAGWEGLRVIEQDGYPARIRSADLDGDGDDELIVVNFRNARLDLYGWKQHGEGQANNTPPPRSDAAHLNDLPMAPEIELTEIPIQQPPIDVAVWPGVGSAESSATLLVLVADPNRLLQFTPDQEGHWKLSRQWDLLAGRPIGIDRVLHVIADAPNTSAQVLISTNEGIQTLTIGLQSARPRQASARWLEPRESVGRNDWWIADLDGDERPDLVEWTNDPKQSLRWYAGSSSGYQPAQTLHDRNIAMATVLEKTEGPDELLVLESSPEGVVRRYRLGQGEASMLGQQEPLTLSGGDNAVWTTLTIDGQPHLVAADPNQPRVTLYAHDKNGWTPAENFPVSGKIKAMYELPHQPGTLVLWPEDGGDLHQSVWAGGRLTFPQPMDIGGNIQDKDILGLGQNAEDLWCVQKAGDDLMLHRIQASPTAGGERSAADSFVINTTRFADGAGKAERAIALDGQRLLVADKFTKGLRVVTLLDDETGESTSTTPSHLSKADLDEFKLFQSADADDREVIQVGRLTDGVVQWLGPELNAVDQAMLPDGRRIGDLILNPDGTAWALQQGGGSLHRLVPDDAGILRVDETLRLDGTGRSLEYDIALGLLMRTNQGVTRLAEGRPRELEVVQSLDARAGRPESGRDATVHRVMSIDIDGDGRDDALLADDTRHQLTALAFDETGQLTPLLSWPVFEDIAYPYGGGGNEQVREPRSVVALDLDGDGRQDLALLSHDRLVIYLGQEPTRELQNKAQP